MEHRGRDSRTHSNAAPPAVTHLPKTPELRHRAALDEYERKNFIDALRMARALIDENFHHANTLAGLIYEEGGHGVEQNFENARFYYERAVETVGAVEGWLGLGRLYFFGEGVEKNYDKAAECYRAVDEDADYHVAQLMLGRIHADAQGTLHNVQQARAYLMRAARNGNVFAYTVRARFEQSEGRPILSLWLRAKAGALALWITWRDPGSGRLRKC